MIFSSDNWAGAHPRIAESLVKAAGGFAAAYGTSALDKKVESLFSEIFERDVAVYFVGTGTAANSLAFASVAKPGGHVFCHREAHVNADECNAPEFFSLGARMAAVDGPFGKMDAGKLAAEIGRFTPGVVHSGQPMAVTLTQATEAGTVYSLDEIAEISAIARQYRLPLHMDGARFANALVALKTTPADMTWKRGVDILSFGATKNGCWCAEALVFFDPAMAEGFPYLRKRSAQLFSKTRFVSAQLEAYFEGGLWLEMARHSNAMARRLADGLKGSNSARLGWAADANELFVIIQRERAQALMERGAVFYDWHPPRDMAHELAEDEGMYRLVTSFATRSEDVDRFLSAL
ncbi:threonine aldolase [Xaviernesmea oryzae]|uniref:L-threonine aldolase n=1 Tax=Xaviernesmea oryzae TaxID=464029 RepID=A0A1Q9AZB8_9HYPH|nr:low specificity L-threonine aldolase [Xaviernesmea oryzae]OLP61042.1 threonine aldolase [Xaviernesmea oryzae]SEL15947.1 L-threonine aldolase [Xaviernesmea oryzae]